MPLLFMLLAWLVARTWVTRVLRVGLTRASLCACGVIMKMYSQYLFRLAATDLYESGRDGGAITGRACLHASVTRQRRPEPESSQWTPAERVPCVVQPCPEETAAAVISIAIGAVERALHLRRSSTRDTREKFRLYFDRRVALTRKKGDTSGEVDDSAAETLR